MGVDSANRPRAASLRRDQLEALRELAETADDGIAATLEEVRRARAGDTPRLSAFVHIPKAAGGTATSMLAGAYPGQPLHTAGNFLADPGATLAKLNGPEGKWKHWLRDGGRFSVGRVPYAAFSKRLPADTRYFTLVREPVDRVVSHWSAMFSGKGGAERSLEEALEQRPPELTNLMTRFLCSKLILPAEELHDGALEEAKRNLRKFAFAGIQGRFDESLVLLQHAQGLGLVPYTDRNVSSRRPALADVPASQRALIAECNALDVELHEFAADLFETAVAEAGFDVAGRAEQLRALSAEKAEREREEAAAFLDRELPAGAERPIAPLLAAAREQGLSPDTVKRIAGARPLSVRLGEDGERSWFRESDADLEAALELFDRVLPEGTTKPKTEIVAAAEEAGVPYSAVKYARGRLSVSKSSDDEGTHFWTRAATGAATEAASEADPLD